MKRFGIDFTRDGGGYYTGQYRTRFKIIVWRFGEIWQNGVEVDYPAGRRPDPPWVTFEPQRTVRHAMQHARSWADLYEEHGPQSYHDSWQLAAKTYPTLFRADDDEAFLDHTFYVIGNGCAWLDGAVVPLSGHLPEYPGDSIWNEHSPESTASEWERRRETMFGGALRELEKLVDGRTDDDELKQLLKRWRKEDEALPAKKTKVYPAAKEYSGLFLVPDDVRTDWLQAAYRAGLAYRDRALTYGVSGDDDPRTQGGTQAYRQKHSAMGAQVVQELEERFGERVK